MEELLASKTPTRKSNLVIIRHNSKLPCNLRTANDCRFDSVLTVAKKSGKVCFLCRLDQLEEAAATGTCGVRSSGRAFISAGLQTR